MRACVRACVLILYKPVLAINLTFRFFGLRSFWSQRGQHRFDAPTPERGASPQPPAPRRSSNHPTTNNKTKSQKIRIRNQNQKGATALSAREKEKTQNARREGRLLSKRINKTILYILYFASIRARVRLCARVSWPRPFPLEPSTKLPSISPIPSRNTQHQKRPQNNQGSTSYTHHPHRTSHRWL